MKELHNHIFSNTTCISKEIMLRYINKQLSKKELYEVEKHMLDCELCTDAFEGMKMAKNSSMLFAIDNTIDLRTGGRNKKSPIIRNLMVAASLLIIVFGTYFTLNNFNESLDKTNLAVNKVDEKTTQSAAPENFIGQEAIPEANQLNEETVVGELIPNDVIDSELANSEQEKQVETIVEAEKVVVINAKIEDVELLEDEVEYDEEEASIEEVAVEKIEAIISKDNLTNERNDNDAANRVEGNVSVATNTVATGGVSEQINTKTKNKKRSSNKPERKHTVSLAEAEPAMEESNIAADRKNTYDIYSYKVYDYAPAYQNDYEFKKANEIDVVSSDFESKADKDVAKKELEENSVEISYKQTLESGIKALKNENYQSALTQFDLILKIHPKDVNALFYGGIAFYNLDQFNDAKIKFEEVLKNKQTTFNQEAKWYQAKNLIALKENKKAKKILQEIIDVNGFYKEQAIEKLGELK